MIEIAIKIDDKWTKYLTYEIRFKVVEGKLGIQFKDIQDNFTIYENFVDVNNIQFIRYKYHVDSLYMIDKLFHFRHTIKKFINKIKF